MTAICELMCSYGVPKTKAAKQFQKAIEKGYARGVARFTHLANPINELASVCSRWYIEKKYTDKTGNPRVLTWDGKRGTLLKLARLSVGNARALSAVKELISRKVVKKVGREGWLPKARVVPPSGLDSAQILRASSMIEALLQTIAHNSKRKYRGDDLLMEVEVQVPRLPARELGSFRKFSKSQGLIYAKTVDDWLESRNVSNARRTHVSTRSVGVIIAAYDRPSRKVRQDRS